ncbi:TolC family protein [Bacteroides sedimenti]|uniref:Transporter n=1 Tax=Bacteroides sedimenti TaxID=2136147 RepID=A0ABM8IDG6_9BACE
MNFKYVCLLVMLLVAGNSQLWAQDSLAVYVQQAIKNNPKVHADFVAYQASLQRVIPAGALPDPELGFSFYLKPMEQVNGKEIGTLSLMQMFPWFGTLKAAKSEMSWMAKASYEKFRESSLDVIFNVQSQWYQLNSIQARLTNIRENIKLLKSLEEIATYRYKSPGVKGGSIGSSAYSPGSSAAAQASPGMSVSTSGGMAGMGGASSVSATSSSTPASMGGNMSSSSMSGSNGSMSDVLRIQIERAELENTLETTQSQYTATLASFNALLGRSSATAVIIPDSLMQKPFIANDSAAWVTVVAQNPMLAMWKAESASYEAKGEMAKKMGYPMIGIGVEYMINGKKPVDMNSMSTMDNMNGMDMIMPMVKFTLPIYRKKYKAQIKESKLMKQSAELQYQNIQNELEASFVAINLRIVDASRKMALYQKQRLLTQTTLELMLREFAASSVSLTDVLQVQRELLGYSLKQVETVVEYNTAVAEFEKIIARSDFILNK